MIVKYSPEYHWMFATIPLGQRPSFRPYSYDGLKGVFQVGFDQPDHFEVDDTFRVIGDGRIYRMAIASNHLWVLDYAPPSLHGAAVPKLKTGEIQEIVGARTDGKYGPETVRKVKEFQWKLIHLGYLHGKANGLWGSRTELAYERYVTAHHTRKVPTTQTSAPEGTKQGRNK